MVRKRTKGRRRKKAAVPIQAAGERLLALDCSSVAVGWAVFEEEKLIDYGKYRQVGDAHGEKLMNYRAWLLDIFKKFKPDHVTSEAPFAGRRANAFLVLSYYMAALLEAYYLHFGHELPDFNKFPAHLAKRYCEMPRTKSHEQNKRAGVKMANELYNLELKYKENDKTKRVSDDDIADAILLGHAWYRRVEDQGSGR